MMELPDCLAKNRVILGPKCNNLGKKSRSFLLGGHKVFLSYTNKNGWEVLKLNIFQIFLRSVFGVYKSTHLDAIAKKFNKLKLTSDLQDCHARIQACWTRKNLIGLGNAPSSEAKVICFPEQHGDSTYRASIAQLINSLYKEGDVVLVEGLEAGEVIPANSHQQTRNVKPNCIVNGWEPENYKTLNDAFFKEANAKYKELEACCHYFRDNLRMKGNMTAEEIITIKLKLDDLVEKIKNLNEYYKSQSNLILGAKKIFEDVFEKLKNGTLSECGSHGAVLYYIITCILRELEKNQEEALYKNETPEALKEVFKSVPLRNASLVKEIIKHRQEGRKVFVVAGASHLLEYPSPYVGCKEVHEALKKDKFILIPSKSLFNAKIAQLNRFRNMNIFDSLA